MQFIEAVKIVELNNVAGRKINLTLSIFGSYDRHNLDYTRVIIFF